jgi:hypothetical protein
MSDEIIVAESRQINDIRVSEKSVREMGERISLMKTFVSNQLNDDINGDYAKIPGTQKKSLLKPGAEKLCLLFNLGFQFEIINQVVDFAIDEVSFLIKCQVYRKSDKEVVGEYMGFCSNQEKKYKNQAATDIVNTILKMGQKRAFVGATISATGASDYFTQDLEDSHKNKTVDASKFTNKDSSIDTDWVVPSGKFKDKKIGSIPKQELESYINYMTSKGEPNGWGKEFVDKGREILRAA